MSKADLTILNFFFIYLIFFNKINVDDGSASISILY